VAAHALPLGAGETGKLADRLADDVQRAQVMVVHRRPRRRRWSVGGIAAGASADGAGCDGVGVRGAARESARKSGGSV